MEEEAAEKEFLEIWGACWKHSVERGLAEIGERRLKLF